jgi:flagellar biogenesis protein FliO
MNRIPAKIWSLPLAVVILFSTVNAQAQTANRLTKVDYQGAEDRIEFGFESTRTLSPKNVSARTDGAVLIISLNETTVKRHWLKLKDFDIKRALVHPAREGTTARLRIRFHEKMDAIVARNIRVRIEGKRVVAAIPRSVSIARSWETATPEPKEQPSAPTIAPTTPKESKGIDKAATVAVATPLLNKKPIAAARKLERAPVVKVVPSAKVKVAPSAKVKVEPTSSMNAVEKNTPVTNAVGQPSGQGAKVGAFAMALLFLVGIGFVLFRKMRQRAAPIGSGPMIRPVGTHMLGPKQGLLLVDVAGDMVLLGTSDKGVQMLTRIEGRETLDTEELASKVTPSPTAVPDHAIPTQAKSGFAERFGRALSRIRETGHQPNNVQQPYTAVQQQAESQYGGGVDPLSEMVNRADNVNLTERRHLRRDFMPVEPRTEAPVYAAQPPVVQSDDLLNKLRNLQSA